MAISRALPSSALGLAALACLAVVTGALAGADPALAIGLAAAVGFAILAFANLTAGVIGLITISMLESTALANPGLSSTKIIGIVIALSWLARLASDENARRQLLLLSHPVLSYLLLMFLAWAAISVVWAEDPGAAGTDLTRYALNLALVPIVFTAVRNARQAWLVAASFAAVATLTSAYGFLSGPGVDADGASRLVGTIGDPNELAATLIAAMALAAAVGAGAPRGSGTRIAGVIAVGICFSAFMLTGSRGGVIAMGFALVALLVVAARSRGRVAIGVLAVALLGTAFYTTLAPEHVRERITTTLPGDERALGGRQTVWKVGWRMATDQPARGVGVGNFQTASIHYALEPGRALRTEEVIDKPEVAHNTYLHIWAELGLVGLALFAAIVGGCFAAAGRAIRIFSSAGQRRLAEISKGVVVALAGLLAAYFFISEQFSHQLWLLLALCPALLHVAVTGYRDGLASTT